MNAGSRPDAPDPSAGVEAGVVSALRDVTAKLDAPGLGSRERIRLLQRQAELGDLRDELELRARRRLAASR